MNRLEPCSLEKLAPFDPSYLAGFQVGRLSLDLDNRFTTVNARTGEVQGNRPWSAGKSILVALGTIMVIFGVFILLNRH